MVVRWIRKQLAGLAHRTLLCIYECDRIGELDGVRLSCVNERASRFLETVTAAMGLIRDHDRARYARILQFVDWIVEDTGPFGSGGAFYSRGCRAILLDPDFDRYESEAILASQVASVIVHEATHGRLFHLGIPYTDETWEQCERICVAEENRFLRRLIAAGVEVPEWLVVDFDPESGGNTGRLRSGRYSNSSSRATASERAAWLLEGVLGRSEGWGFILAG